MLNDCPTGKDVHIKIERLEAKNIVIAVGMAPNACTRRSRSRRYSRGRVEHGASRHEHSHRGEGIEYLMGVTVDYVYLHVPCPFNASALRAIPSSLSGCCCGDQADQRTAEE